MKTGISAIAFLCIASSHASAVNADAADTILSIKDADKITIIESPTGVKITVDGNSTDHDYQSTYTQDFDKPTLVKSKTWRSIFPLSGVNEKSHKWSFEIGGIGFGLTHACGQPSNIGIEMSKSWEISILNAIGLRYRLPNDRSSISVGFGFDWRNYKMSGNTRFIPIDGHVGAGAYPEDVIPGNSRLKVFSMGIPILWEQKFKIFGSKSRITAGVILNYNSHASMLTNWTNSDGNKVEQTTNHIGHRRFTADIIAIANIWKFIGWYVRYSPCTVLRGAFQPEFRPLSTGIIFFY